MDVTRLLKDIILLQNEVSSFKRNYATKQSVDELCTDVANLKCAPIINNCGFVNRKRGAQLFDSYTYGSGPIGLQLSPEATNVTVEVVTKSSNYHNEENSSSPTHLQTDKASAVSPVMESSALCAGTGQVSANIDESPVSLAHNNKRQHSIASPVRVVEGSMNKMSLAAGAGINGTHTLVNTKIDATELQMQPVKPVLSNVSTISAKHTTVESYAQEIADVFARGDSGSPLREKVEKKNENDDFVLVQRKKKRTANKFVGLRGRNIPSFCLH